MAADQRFAAIAAQSEQNRGHTFTEAERDSVTAVTIRRTKNEPDTVTDRAVKPKDVRV
jgi:hypothetical protein